MKRTVVPNTTSGSHGDLPSFLDHPLCKELKIGSLAFTSVEQKSQKNTMAPRSCERRCAMDLVNNEDEVEEEEEDLLDANKIISVTNSPDSNIDQSHFITTDTSTMNIVLQTSRSSHHREDRRPSFIEHPLCKELKISTVTAPLDEPMKKNHLARSRRERRRAMALVTTTQGSARLERRCAMTLVTTTHKGSPSEVQKDLETSKQKRSNLPEFVLVKKESFHQNNMICQSHFQTNLSSPNSMQDDVNIEIASESRVCCELDRTRHPSCQSIDWNNSDTPAAHSREEFGILRPASSSNDLGPYIKRLLDNSSNLAFNNVNTSSNENGEPPRRRSSLMILLTALKDTGGSLLTNLILSGDGEEVLSESDNILLDEMRRIEDQNIWNTIRKRHYEE